MDRDIAIILSLRLARTTLSFSSIAMEIYCRTPVQVREDGIPISGVGHSEAAAVVPFARGIAP